MRNLRVLATDQKTESKTNEDGKTVVKTFRMVTVEVTPKIAEKLAVAQTIGTLSLSLRSLADNQAELERAIASGEVDVPDGVSPSEEEEILRTAMNTPNDKLGSFVTGGEVSRFQSSAFKRDTGPQVRVTRGKNASAVNINGANGLVSSQANGMGQVGAMMPAVQATQVIQ
jgi:pilus assembly protein CpaB